MLNIRLMAALKEARAMLAPPPNLSVAEWADRYRQVASKTSAVPGKWRTSVQPIALGPMLAAEPDTSIVTIMAGTQICKTETLLNILGYHIHVDPAAVLFICPTQGAAEAFSKERFAPMIAATPALKELVALPRSRDSGNTINHKDFIRRQRRFCWRKFAG